MSEQRSLRTWRERIAAPLLIPSDDVVEEVLSQNAKTGQNPISDLVGIGVENPCQNPDSDAKTPSQGYIDIDISSYGDCQQSTVDKPRLVRTGPKTWREADWCRGLCVNCEEPLATGDVIACTWHRAQLDALVMPWERGSDDGS